MEREILPELKVASEKIFNFSDEEIDEIIEEIDNGIEETARINRMKEIQSIQHAKKFVVSSNLVHRDKKKKEIHYLNMEEKKQMVLNGEHIPIQVGESNFNKGPVKYYSRTLKKKMKL